MGEEAGCDAVGSVGTVGSSGVDAVGSWWCGRRGELRGGPGELVVWTPRGSWWCGRRWQ